MKYILPVLAGLLVIGLIVWNVLIIIFTENVCTGLC